jgi:hypothetical protein
MIHLQDHAAEQLQSSGSNALFGLVRQERKQI